MKEVSRAIIIDDEGKVLLGKRGRGIAAGQYALIGGKPEPGESPKDAIIREVKEEIGLQFSPDNLFYQNINTITDPDNPWMTYYFTGSATGELMLDSKEIKEVVYVAEKELDDVDIAFDHRERVKEFFRSRRK